MKKKFTLDTNIYSEIYILKAILDYQDVAKIEYADSILSIEAGTTKNIDEIFTEFMNYVLSLGTELYPKNAITAENLDHIDTGKIGYFRFKKFTYDSYLITNDIGKFHFLSHDNFFLFIQGKYEAIPGYNDLIEKGFIMVPDYESGMIDAYRKRMSFVGQGPGLHMIIVTLRCNHHCKYCHAAVAPETATQFDMSLEMATKSVDTIMFTNVSDLTIEFQGGEPLLNWPIIQHIVEYAREKEKILQKNVLFSLVTNLTLMTEEKLKWLIDHRVDICTSLDGNELLHNSNRTGYKGNSYEKVSYWIRRVNEEKQKIGMGKTGALLTVTKTTLPHYKEVIDTYIDLDLDGIFLRWLNPYGFASSDMKTLAYKPEEWIDFYEKSLDYIIELNRQGIYFREYITHIYLQKIFSDFDPNFMDIRSPSGIAIGGVAYNYDGKVYASDESRMLGRMGIDDFLMTEPLDTGEKTYRAMMESDVTKIAVQSSLLDALPGYSDHVYKPYLGVDIIHNFKVEGSVYTPLVKDKKMQLQIGILDVIFSKLADPEQRAILYSWLEK